MACNKCSQSCNVNYEPHGSSCLDNDDNSNIKKLIINSRKHDRNKCTCMGCYHYNMGFTIMQNSRYYFVVDGWRDIPRDEHLRAFQRLLNYKLDKATTAKKLRKFLKSHNAPTNMVPNIIKNMQSSMFIVMFLVSPMGMMREI